MEANVMVKIGKTTFTGPPSIVARLDGGRGATNALLAKMAEKINARTVGRGRGR
jgi:hypothetical protein